MKKFIFLFTIIICITLLSGCSLEPEYPYIAYYNSSYRFDAYNRIIEIPNGYILDQSHFYDMTETESGYDLIIHLIKEQL